MPSHTELLQNISVEILPAQSTGQTILRTILKLWKVSWLLKSILKFWWCFIRKMCHFRHLFVNKLFLKYREPLPLANFGDLFMGILTYKKPLVICFCFRKKDVSLVQKGSFLKSVDEDCFFRLLSLTYCETCASPSIHLSPVSLIIF